jgi:uncharacterized metal-binding protein YceD (DUF177 family)
MTFLNQYTVPFNGLDNTDYDFDFTITDEFFACFEKSEIKGGDVAVKLILTKKTHSLELDITVRGDVKVECDRCLDEYYEEIEFSNKIMVEFGDETNFDTDDDFVFFFYFENEINISQFIYEFCHFALPFTRYHYDDENGNSGCNPEMIAILDKLRTTKTEEIADPRWAKLTEIKNNNVK